MGDRRLARGACGVFLLALALRLGSLYWSPLPFNPDGVGYAARTRDALALGSLPLDGMATDQVGYTAFLAVVSALAGDAPLAVAQPVSALVGAATVFLVVVLGYRLVRDGRANPGSRTDGGPAVGSSSRSPADARVAGLVAGLVLAVEGVYLYRSMPTDEQTAGLLLVPALVLAVDRWLRTGDRAWGGVAALLAVPLPPLHNLSGLAGAVAVTVVTCVVAVRRLDRATTGRALAVVAAAWLYAVGYHALVATYTGLEVVQADRLVRVPGLFAAWVVLVVLAAAWFLTTADRFRRATVLGVVVASFSLVGLNAVRTVFPSTTPTRRSLLVLLFPLVVPALVAGVAAARPARSRSVGATTVALLFGTLAVVGTGLTAQLTFPYLALVYRSHLFAHLPLVALAGVGVAAIGSRGPGSDRARSVLVVAVVACALASTPVAYAGLDVRTYKSVTTPAEFAATEFAATELDGWATDDHLGRVAGYHGGGGGRGPVYRWLRADDRPPPCPVLAQRSWTGVGAQFHPQPPATLSSAGYDDWRARNDVVYAVAARDPLAVVLPRGSGGSC